ncbi:response regulator transcription factor [Paenibacillus graminis]|uniref:response regulator transcription factor n=1 Tax=Paenibacillus graminis TaxID=189425 RepID=UPI002DB5A348|nr:response regulator transcription factor [Paenibacillus graminis]MEC0170019.1 response regulator transcription factor [Paenibacillus graminis]
MKSKILLIDDEKGIISILKNYFESSGFQVYSALSGNEALERVHCQPDIILLDINMPDIDGITVCQRIRKYISCPILFLTARVESKDKIVGFRAGADDYIVKPFDIDELGARVEAHLRRENRMHKQSIIRFFGDLTVDYSKREVSVSSFVVPLSKREFEIVELLSMNSGQVFDREHIYEAIWGTDGEGSSDTIMEHIRKVRAKLAVFTQNSYIDTVWGVGYKWNG